LEGSAVWHVLVDDDDKPGMSVALKLTSEGLTWRAPESGLQLGEVVVASSTGTRVELKEERCTLVYGKEAQYTAFRYSSPQEAQEWANKIRVVFGPYDTIPPPESASTAMETNRIDTASRPICFVAVEGVLSCESQPGGLDPQLVSRLSKICRVTGAQVVLASGWREQEERRAQFFDTLRASGIENKLLGEQTPPLPCPSPRAEGCQTKQYAEELVLYFEERGGRDRPWVSLSSFSLTEEEITLIVYDKEQRDMRERSAAAAEARMSSKKSLEKSKPRSARMSKADSDENHHIQCNPEEGLSEEEAQKAICILGVWSSLQSSPRAAQAPKSVVTGGGTSHVSRGPPPRPQNELCCIAM